MKITTSTWLIDPSNLSNDEQHLLIGLLNSTSPSETLHEGTAYKFMHNGIEHAATLTHTLTKHRANQFCFMLSKNIPFENPALAKNFSVTQHCGSIELSIENLSVKYSSSGMDSQTISCKNEIDLTTLDTESLSFIMTQIRQIQLLTECNFFPAGTATHYIESATNPRRVQLNLKRAIVFRDTNLNPVSSTNNTLGYRYEIIENKQTGSGQQGEVRSVIGTIEPLGLNQWIAKTRDISIVKSFSIDNPFFRSPESAKEKIRREATFSKLANRKSKSVTFDSRTRTAHLILQKFNGGDLFDFLVNEREPNAATYSGKEKIKQFIIPLIEKLMYLHKQGIIHRDIKPENIMLENNEPHFIDLGLAKASNEKNDAPCGSPDYVAPEILVGMEASEESDAYSLANVIGLILGMAQPGINTENLKSLFVGINDLNEDQRTKIENYLIDTGQVNPCSRPPLDRALSLFMDIIFEMEYPETCKMYYIYGTTLRRKLSVEFSQLSLAAMGTLGQAENFYQRISSLIPAPALFILDEQFNAFLSGTGTTSLKNVKNHNELQHTIKTILTNYIGAANVLTMHGKTDILARANEYSFTLDNMVALTKVFNKHLNKTKSVSSGLGAVGHFAPPPTKAPAKAMSPPSSPKKPQTTPQPPLSPNRRLPHITAVRT